MKNNRKKSVKVYLPGGAKEISELNDKQLKNVAHYNHLTDEEKKNVRNNLTKSGIMLSVAGGLSGLLMIKKPLRGAGIGAVTGAGIGALLGIRGHKLHKKQALAAEEEMKNREKDKQKVYSVTMTEDELRLFSEFLEQREFSSKAQKARRRKFDLSIAEMASDGYNPDTYFKPSKDDMIRKGRAALKSNKTDLGFELTKTSPLHENINLTKPNDILNSRSKFGTNIPSKERVGNRLTNQEFKRTKDNWDNFLKAYNKSVKRERKLNNEKTVSTFIKKHGKTAAAIAIPVTAVGTGVVVYKKHKKSKENKKED